MMKEPTPKREPTPCGERDAGADSRPLFLSGGSALRDSIRRGFRTAQALQPGADPCDVRGTVTVGAETTTPTVAGAEDACPWNEA
jgi:hypothetical protein